MPRVSKKYIFDFKREVIQERFHELGEKGKHPPRMDLCTFEEYYFKETVKGSKKRTQSERENFLLERYAAKLEKSKMKQDMKGSDANPNSSIIQEVMQAWLDHVSKFRSGRTVQHYLKAVNYYAESVGNHPIGEFKKYYQEIFKSHLEAAGLSLASQKTYIVEIQRFFNWALEEEYIDRQIRLNKPRVTKREPIIYSQEDLHRLEKRIDLKYRNAKSSYRKLCFRNQMRALIMLKETAMRGGEVWSLLLENIKLEERIILLRDNDEISWNIKNRMEAVVPISEALAEFLKEDLASRNNGERWYLDNGQGILLYSTRGELTQAFQRHCKALGLSGVKPLHGIRATVITRLLEMGVDVSIAKKLARHQDIATTMGYVRSQNLPVKQAVDLLRNANESPIKKIEN